MLTQILYCSRFLGNFSKKIYLNFLSSSRVADFAELLLLLLNTSYQKLTCPTYGNVVLDFPVFFYHIRIIYTQLLCRI